MAITFVASVSATPGPNGGATSAIDTSGAHLLVLSVSWYSGGTTALTVSDSKSNTWTALTIRNAGTAAHRYYYAANPTVGSGHTVTVSASGIYPVLIFRAYGGVATSSPFETENGATTSGGSPLSAGSVTPAANGALIVSGWAGMNNTFGGGVAPPLGGAIGLNPNPGVCVAGVDAYYIQPTAAAINPSWTWFGVDPVAVSVAVFKAPTTAVGRSETFIVMPV